MLLLSADQIRQADQYTIQHEPISSLDLMERASQKCVDWIETHFNSSTEKFLIICGPGNNGGDGLAIARLLQSLKYSVEVILLGEKFSEDNQANQNKWKEVGGSIFLMQSFSKCIAHSTVILDCLFGTGLNKIPEGVFKDVIEKINASGKTIVSIDLPSGMMDVQQKDFKTIVKADFTLTFQFPKLGFLLPDTGVFAGKWNVIEIGLLEEGYKHEKPLAYFVTKDYIKGNFKKRETFSHKGTYGHAILIGGSYGKIGAMTLACKACLMTGAGLVTAVLPECGYGILQTSLPEVMVRISKGEYYQEDFNLGNISYHAIGIGPGMGIERETADAFKLLIQNSTVPLVIDADALNILSENKTWLHFLPAGSILTPHPGEFQRLVGKWNSCYEMIELQKEFSFKYQCIVVLKGAYTSITTPGGNLFFNSSGNPGLAKGGSGDTLTGIITSLCAQGLTTLEAAISGVYLHGLAADLAVKNIHEYSLLPTDVIHHISDAIHEIQA